MLTWLKTIKNRELIGLQWVTYPFSSCEVMLAPYGFVDVFMGFVNDNEKYNLTSSYYIGSESLLKSMGCNKVCQNAV